MRRAGTVFGGFRGAVAAAALVGALAFSGSASAELTDAEKAQVGDYYRNGRPADAPRVRALLARPDLNSQAVATTFGNAARTTPFDPKHRDFVHALLFGSASASARSDLLPPVIDGLLRRAEQITAAGGPPEGRAAELVRLHAFVTFAIAPSAADPSAGSGAAAIRADARRQLVEVYRKHLALPALDPERLPPPMLEARTQAEIALMELARGTVPTADVAAWIGSTPEQRRALARTETLVSGLGASPAARARAVAFWLENQPSIARAVDVLWIGKPRPLWLDAPGRLAVAPVPFGTKQTWPARARWPSSVEATDADAFLHSVAYALAEAAVAERLLADAAFAQAAARAHARASSVGPAGFLAAAAQSVQLAPSATKSPASAGVSPAHTIAHGAELLLVDAPRALAVATSQSLAGRHAPFEQLALALDLLARPPGGDAADRLLLGRPGDGGGVSSAEVTGLRFEGGQLVGFTMDKHVVALKRSTDGAVTSVTIDGKAPTLTVVPHVLTPTAPGERWTSGGRVLERVSGQPEVGFGANDEVLVRAPSGTGRGAVAIRAKLAEAAIRFSASASEGCEVVGRAGETSSGLVLRWTASGVTLSARDAKGQVTPLGAPLPLGAPSEDTKYEITLRRTDASIAGGKTKRDMALPPFLVLPQHIKDEGADVEIVVPDGGACAVRGLSITTP